MIVAEVAKEKQSLCYTVSTFFFAYVILMWNMGKGVLVWCRGQNGTF